MGKFLQSVRDLHYQWWHAPHSTKRSDSYRQSINTIAKFRQKSFDKAIAINAGVTADII